MPFPFNLFSHHSARVCSMSPPSPCTRPHALMLPFPETGHINPLMHLAQYLSSYHGFLITFVNTQYNHSRIVKANSGRLPSEHGLDIQLVGIPDGLSDDDNRDNDVPIFVRLIENIGPVLEELICKINAECPQRRVTCIISDVNAFKTIDVAQKLGIPRIAFWPPNASVHSYICHASHASSTGEFSAKGVPDLGEMVSFPGVPSIEGTKLPWVVGSEEEIEAVFHSVSRNVNALRQSEWVICNSVHELEPTVQDLLPAGYPKVCPVGPILPIELLEKSDTRQDRITTSMWVEQDECLDWLDTQEAHSVLYVSVGSFAMLNKEQLLELAHGLEASETPILWVLREDLAKSADNLPEGYRQRNERRIRIVEWCPQLLVLSHKSVGAFLTHCGWNSTLEGMSMGVPMLTWPQMVDQFVNAELVVKEWGVGMELGQGFVGWAVVESKVRKLMSADGEARLLRAKAAETRSMILEARRGGGSSQTNLLRFVHWMKQQSEVIVENGRVH
ncbi:hypothetical protein L7F22_000242 [Adiantum nelumboides]|nr:hypothetical protein [Adiantum nelumboides]